ncbi:hypothetical protein MOUN0_B02190 [Monosporozyma unispora]
MKLCLVGEVDIICPQQLTVITIPTWLVAVVDSGDGIPWMKLSVLSGKLIPLVHSYIKKASMVRSTTPHMALSWWRPPTI